MERYFKEDELAMFNESLPCNPLPFLNTLTNNVRTEGTDHIKTDKAKALLWVILAQSYGQTFKIDSWDEWLRLKYTLIPKGE